MVDFYQNQPDIAIPGMLADTMYKRTVSRPVGQEEGVIPGVFVAEDANGKVFLPGTADTTLSGVSQHDHTLVGYPTNTLGVNKVSPRYDKTQAMSVLQRGSIWVLVATGATLNGMNQPVSVVTTGAQAGFAIQAGAASSAVVPNALTRGKPFTMKDGRRIIEVELHAGNAA